MVPTGERLKHHHKTSREDENLSQNIKITFFLSLMVECRLSHLGSDAKVSPRLVDRVPCLVLPDVLSLTGNQPKAIHVIKAECLRAELQSLRFCSRKKVSCRLRQKHLGVQAMDDELLALLTPYSV